MVGKKEAMTSAQRFQQSQKRKLEREMDKQYVLRPVIRHILLVIYFS